MANTDVQIIWVTLSSNDERAAEIEHQAADVSLVLELLVECLRLLGVCS